MTPIRTLAVIVPAHDEEEGIVQCLAGVRTALSRVPSTVACTVTVVLDRCRDATPRCVETVIADWPGAVSLRLVAAGGERVVHTADGPTHVVAGSGVGTVRNVGVHHALERALPVPPESVWLLFTDADSTVPADWALTHLAIADAGAAGVAGNIELADGPARAADRYDRLVRAYVDRGRPLWAYGSNLGVRGDAFLSTGGFRTEGAGSDDALWQALRSAGYPLEQPMDLRVRTSARVTGRVSGGLADLLNDLEQVPSSR